MKAAVVHAFDRPLEIEDRSGGGGRGLSYVCGFPVIGPATSTDITRPLRQENR